MSIMESGIDNASKMEEIFVDNGDALPALFNVDSKDIKEGKKIGDGIWTVHEAEWLGRKVAVKKIIAESTFYNVALTSREVKCMLNLRHPNVLKLLGFYLTAQKERVLDCTMIMELMDCDLEDYIGRGSLSNDQVVYIIAEVARGMNHIHKKGCLHRDLKPKNILLRKSVVTGFNVDVKIADFGSLELMGGGNIDPKVGTVGYKAPEQFDSTSKLFPSKVDVFGFGALCFKILTGKKPYGSHLNVREAMKQLDKVAISQRKLSEDVVEMIWKCLDVSPESRPNFEEVSRILDGALSTIWKKMARPLSLSTSTSLHSKKSMSKGVQDHEHFESLFHDEKMGKEYGRYFIPFDELLVICLINEGFNASLYKVEWKGILYVQKIFAYAPNTHWASVFDNSTMRRDYFETFPKLFHKNIVTFMGYSLTSDGRISIIMELQAMDLSSVLGQRKEDLDMPKRWRIVREIAEGMKYLHDQGVVHGDLKPGNVVVSALDTNDMNVKLIDFADHAAFTTKYVAPEILMSAQRRMVMGDHAKKADIYTFGILCQEILGGAPLFEEYKQNKHREAILRGERPPMPIGISGEMEDLIKRCWSGDPKKDPTSLKFV